MQELEINYGNCTLSVSGNTLWMGSFNINATYNILNLHFDVRPGEICSSDIGLAFKIAGKPKFYPENYKIFKLPYKRKCMYKASQIAMHSLNKLVFEPSNEIITELHLCSRNK